MWGTNTAACKAKDGTERIQVRAAGVDYWEAGARLMRVTQAGRDRTIKLKLSYEGEGDFWDKVEIWQISGDGNTLTMSSEDATTASTFVKCRR